MWSTKPVIATKQISFKLEYGDCFALLGINGAGKTSTFKMLTCETNATSGDCTICDKDVAKSFRNVRKMIGYCPQFDTIFPLLTVEEHLYFYARIKKIP
jgi:ABC-type multidrug transport system ATPase subunit